jgi:hypothetical protein
LFHACPAAHSRCSESCNESNHRLAAPLWQETHRGKSQGGIFYSQRLVKWEDLLVANSQRPVVSYAKLMQVISVLQGGVREAGKKYQQSYTRYMAAKIRPGLYPKDATPAAILLANREVIFRSLPPAAPPRPRPP